MKNTDEAHQVRDNKSSHLAKVKMNMNLKMTQMTTK